MPVTIKNDTPVGNSEIKPLDVVRHIQSGAYAFVKAVDPIKGTFEGFGLPSGKHSMNWPLAEHIHYVGPLVLECT